MQIIYDFDGVMFDSYDSVRKEMYPDLARRCGRTLTIEELNYCYEHGMADNVEHIFGDNAWDVIRSLPYERYYSHTQPMPDIVTVLKWFKGAGIKVSICSNRVSGIPFILDYYNLTEYIDNVVTSKDRPSKPDPTGLLSLIDDDDKEVIFIGDGEIDRQTACNAGVQFIAYNNPNIFADAHIKSHLQILHLTPIKEYGIRIAGRNNEHS